MFLLCVIRVSIEERKHELAELLRRAGAGLQLCEHIDQPGDVVFAHACAGLRGHREQAPGLALPTGPG
jgi:hypothetical protein